MKYSASFFSKLNVRIASAFLLLSLVIIGSFTAFIYRSASDMLKTDDMRKTEESIDQASSAIASYLDKIKSFSEIIAGHPDIQRALSGADASSLDSIASLIRLAKDSDERIKSISVVSERGLVITSGSDMAVPISGDMMAQEWYKNALRSSGMPVLTPTGHGVFDMDSEDWIVSICKEIKNEDRAHLGIVIIDISYRFIEDHIKNLALGKNGYVYILAENHSVIYHPDSALLTEDGADLPEISADHTPSVPLLYHTEIPNADWSMYSVAFPDNLRLLKLRLARALMLAVLLTLLFSVIAGILLSRYLSRPIISLTQTMTRADRTWEHLLPDQRSSCEVAALTNEYNRLIDRIQLLTDSIVKKEEDRRLFELRALQSQINPHFLYNTLDTILWLAELKQTEAVAEVTAALGKMLRVSLSNEHAFIRLSLELEHCLSYLKIQKVRYADKLSYEFRGDDALLALQVPKLIVQPIVENAIYHGIRGKKNGGHILIEYRTEEIFLIIMISDNGIGFDPSVPHEDRQRRNVSGGIGMSNVRSRIQLLCGPSFGLDISSAPDAGTSVRLRLPIREESKSTVHSRRA